MRASTPGQHFLRGMLLFQQSRYDLAEAELRRELGQNPENPRAHAFLGLCLCERKEYREAESFAGQAIALAPDDSFTHFALARIQFERNRFEEAIEAVGEAIRLDPDRAEYRGLYAGILLHQRKWEQALRASEEGLALEPENVNLKNLHAQALIMLGRRSEADVALDAALAREPENALTHANRGWAMLEAGQGEKAMEHFREALRLDPELEWARRGILEAMKARSALYRIMLRYFLWTAKMSRSAQWGLVIGLYVGFRLLRTVAGNSAWVLPIGILYVVFCLLTWISSPLFNLFLRLDRFGKLALSREEVRASNLVGLCLAVGLGSAIAYLALGRPGGLLASMAMTLCAVPVSGAFQCEAGWPRWVMGAAAGLLSLLSLAAVLLLLFAAPGSEPASWAGSLPVVVFLGVLISSLAGNALIAVQPKK